MAGTGSHAQLREELGATGNAPVSARELRRKLVQVFGDKRYKAPVLPAAAHELMALSKKPNVSFDDVQRVIEKDTSIAGKVLNVAQSPIYATRVRAKTLRDAAQRLGLNNIRDIVWQVAMEVRVFQAAGYEPIMEALQRHSVATAHLARVVCRYTTAASEHAFLCGLLHDVGLSGMLIAVAEKADGELPPLAALWEGLVEGHPEASAYMLRLWKLDDELQAVASKHHVEGDRPDSALVTVVRVAERLASDAGYGVVANEEWPPLDSLSEEAYEAALAALGVNDASMRALTHEAKDTLARL